jgi:hypothetical protein
MIKSILDLMKAMKLGEEVGNPRKWKKGQIKMNALAGLLLIGISYLPIPPEYITPEVVDMLCDAIVGIVLLFNGILTVVHTRKLGVTE